MESVVDPLTSTVDTLQAQVTGYSDERDRDAEQPDC